MWTESTQCKGNGFYALGLSLPFYMKKTRPIKPNFVSQRFGENRLPIYKQMGMQGHSGIDIPCPNGAELRFEVKDCHGLVYKKETDSAGGLGLDIITEDRDGIFKHRYWHLQDFTVEVGDIVGTGDLLGHCDNTGMSTGSHLHWGLKPQIKDSNGVYRNEFQNNGYYGAVSFTWENIYVKKLLDNLEQQVGVIQQIINLIKGFFKHENI